MFVTSNRVRMHDTDMAGILYFPRQFRFVHDALEDFIEHECGHTFHEVFHTQDFVFVIVHAEADYLTPLRVGNHLKIHLEIEQIGTTSFTVNYLIYREPGELVGKAKTVHVTLDAPSRKKIPIPEKFKKILQKHINQ